MSNLTEGIIPATDERLPRKRSGGIAIRIKRRKINPIFKGIRAAINAAQGK